MVVISKLEESTIPLSNQKYLGSYFGFGGFHADIVLKSGKVFGARKHVPLAKTAMRMLKH